MTWIIQYQEYSMEKHEYVNWMNCTPHDIKIKPHDKLTIYIPVSGNVARCKSTDEQIGTVGGVPLIKPSYGKVENLPNMKDTSLHVIVSAIVAKACKDHPHADRIFAVVNTVKDENGNISHCTAICPASHF